METRQRIACVLFVSTFLGLAGRAAPQAQLAKWLSPDTDPTVDVTYKEAVAVDDEHLLVGCTDFFGRARVRVFSSVTGTKIVDLTVPGALPASSPLTDAISGFGDSLALLGERALIGAANADQDAQDAGRAYLFDVETGALELTLSYAEFELQGAFGTSVAMDSDYFVVGAPRVNANSLDDGAAYVFDATTGSQLARLVSPQNTVLQRFGTGVAVGGGVIVVGAPFQFGSSQPGRAYAFDAASGNLLFELLPSSSLAGDNFGATVATDGVHAVVGAPRSPGSPFSGPFGRVQVFDLSTGLELHSIGAPAGINWFGRDVALDGSTVGIGSFGISDGVYLFDLLTTQLVSVNPDPLTGGRGIAVRDGLIATANLSGGASILDQATGQTLQQIGGNAGDLAHKDGFGTALAVLGDVALVGAPQDAGLFSTSGSAYLFDLGTGAVTQTLSAPNGAGLFFGSSVAVSGSRILVGSRLTPGPGPQTGNAWVFDASTQQPLYAITGSNPGQADQFGASVAADGDLAVVGAPFFGAGDKGAAYAFDLSTGLELFRLLPSDPGSTDRFGTSAAVQGQRAVVGAPFHDTGTSNTGAAYVFDLSSAAQLFRLVALDAALEDKLGTSVAIDEQRVLVGAPASANAASAGAAYLFDLATGAQLAKLVATDGASGDTFGSSVALVDGLALVGAPLADTTELDAGAVYVFDATTYLQLAKLETLDTNPNAHLGVAVAADSGRIYAGADTAAAVYVFDAPASEVPFVYCTAKPSSVGCLASIGTLPAASQPLSAANNYAVIATSVHGAKAGILFGGVSAAALIPFSGGTLCVEPPLKRGALQFSAGTVGTCDGSFSALVNDGLILPLGLDAGAGNSGWYQYWYRDPQNGSGTLGTALSNALRLDFL